MNIRCAKVRRCHCCLRWWYGRWYYELFSNIDSIKIIKTRSVTLTGMPNSATFASFVSLQTIKQLDVRCTEQFSYFIFAMLMYFFILMSYYKNCTLIMLIKAYWVGLWSSTVLLPSDFISSCLDQADQGINIFTYAWSALYVCLRQSRLVIGWFVFSGLPFSS